MSKIQQVFNHILQYGKMSSLQYLYKTEYENIKAYNNWLKTIKTQDLDIETMRTYYEIPIRCIKLVNDDDIDKIIRQMCIYRHNLEGLTKTIVTVPAYRFYDIAIIILFLMNNPRLIILPRDMLRKIAAFVFN
jgi:hypothetical protein